jgi:integrase
VLPKLTKRIVDAAQAQSKDYVIWDDDLRGFGLRVFTTGKRSYVLQYRALGRSRRYTIGPHGVWTPETARREALIQLGRVAKGENPAEERELDHKAITVKQLCERYLDDLGNGLILGKGNRPKRPSTKTTDTGRINRHIIPLVGTRRVKDLTQPEIIKIMMDIMAGRTRVNVKTSNLRGRSIVTGGAGTAARTIGLLSGILTYAVNLGIIEKNPAHGIKRPKDHTRRRRLSEGEYRVLGELLRNAEAKANEELDNSLSTAVKIIRQIALTGCRRGEIIGLKWAEADTEGSAFRFSDTKTGESIRPIGLPVVEFLDATRADEQGVYVFPGERQPVKAYGSFPKQWSKLVKGTALEGITAHVLRHSFASIANDLGFTEVTIAALLGHSKGTMTSKYIHTMDGALIMAADTVSSYIDALLKGVEFKQTIYAFDRKSRRKAALRFLQQQQDPEELVERNQAHWALP